MADVFTIYKLIVLYMAQQSKEELTNSQISQFVLDRDYTDYFHLQQVLSELVETGLLKKRTKSNSSYYDITEEGSKTLFYFEKDLSSEIKDCGVQTEKKIQTPADYFETPQGGYAVRCQYIEKDATMLDLTLSAPSLEAARAICRNWPKKSPDVYAAVMGELI